MTTTKNMSRHAGGVSIACSEHGHRPVKPFSTIYSALLSSSAMVATRELLELVPRRNGGFPGPRGESTSENLLLLDEFEAAQNDILCRIRDTERRAE